MHQQPPTAMHSPSRWHQVDENIISPRPVSMSKSRSLQGIAEHQEVQSFSESFDVPDLQPVDTSSSATEPKKQDRPKHTSAGSISSVKLEGPALFGEVSRESHVEDGSRPVLRAPSSPNRPSLSPRRMSISDLKLEPGISASIEETNVTLDDIAQFIEGPMPDDGKWVCKYEDCNKRFGRKENIKSHVQTHLGDRQFRCDHCQKCFVRGHDLKRHAKIHTGTKAYACLCGNAFARHDALTRHRQRGMCIGAFEGVVRKDVKRGRPRKHRPEMDERLDKASRSRRNRQQASEAQPTSFNDIYASSASSCSISSWGSPPTETMDNLSIHAGAPGSPQAAYEDTLNLFDLTPQEVGQNNSMEPMSQAALPSDMFSSFTPPTSPSFSTGNKPSPSYRGLTSPEMASLCGEPNTAQPSGRHSHSSHQIIDESAQSSQASLPPASPHFTQASGSSNLFSNDLLTVQSCPTAAPSLPALSHSSSPPPQEPSSALVFDFSDDPNPFRMSAMSNISNMSFGLSTIKARNSISHAQPNNEEPPRNDFDSFLDYDDSQLGMKYSMDDNDAFFAGI